MRIFVEKLKVDKVSTCLCAVALATAVFTPQSAMSSGNEISGEASARFLGRAGAGRAADPETALSASYNPAQYSALPGLNLSVSAGYIAPEGDADITTAFGSDGRDDFYENGPIAAFALSYEANETFTFGLSVGPSFGLTVDHGSDFSASPLVTRVDMKTFAITPAVSVALTDELSFGVAPIAEIAIFDYRSAVAGVGVIDRDYDPSLAFGAVFGLRYEPTPTTNLGLMARLSPDHEFDGKITSGFSGSSDYDHDAPNIVELGLRQEVPGIATLFAGVAWYGWSVVDETEIEEPDSPLGDVVAPRDWDDGWRFSVGVERDLTSRLTGRFGVSYSTNFIDEDRRVPDVPYDRQIRLGLGLSYAVTDATGVHIGYEYADLGDGDTDLSAADYGGLAVNGAHHSSAHVLGVEVSRRF